MRRLYRAQRIGRGLLRRNVARAHVTRLAHLVDGLRVANELHLRRDDVRRQALSIRVLRVLSLRRSPIEVRARRALLAHEVRRHDETDERDDPDRASARLASLQRASLMALSIRAMPSRMRSSLVA